MIGAVAGGVDVRIRGAAQLVDDDAVVAGQPGLRRQFHVGNDADADDHQVGSECGFAAKYLLDPAVARKAGHGCTGVKGHAATAVQFVVELRHSRCGYPLQDAVFHLDHTDLEAGFDAHGRDLQADVSPADHHDFPAGRHFGPDGIHVRDGSQVMDAREVVALDLQQARPAARGEQQLRIGERPAVRSGDGSRGTVDGFDPNAGPDGHVPVRVELLRTEVDAFQAVLTGQVLLRERRALIGDVGLVADDDDLSLVSFLTQAGGGLPAGVSCSYDDD